jgi:hypothetical protein
MGLGCGGWRQRSVNVACPIPEGVLAGYPCTSPAHQATSILTPGAMLLISTYAEEAPCIGHASRADSSGKEHPFLLQVTQSPMIQQVFLAPHFA